jgi:hypothetical protein
MVDPLTGIIGCSRTGEVAEDGGLDGEVENKLEKELSLVDVADLFEGWEGECGWMLFMSLPLCVISKKPGAWRSAMTTGSSISSRPFSPPSDTSLS